jgi:hypothetical protein
LLLKKLGEKRLYRAWRGQKKLELNNAARVRRLYPEICSACKNFLNSLINEYGKAFALFKKIIPSVVAAVKPTIVIEFEVSCFHHLLHFIIINFVSNDLGPTTRMVAVSPSSAFSVSPLFPLVVTRESWAQVMTQN